MIKCQKFYLPFPLKKKWVELYRKGCYTPFQSWLLNRLWFLVFGLKGTRRKFQPIFYFFKDDETDKRECIVPVLVNKKEKVLANYSQFGPIDYYDIIYSSDNDTFLGDCLNLLFKEYSGYVLNFENVPEDSILCKLLEGCEKKIAPCVRIEIQTLDYNDYYQALSKHQRQNLRTAYNKLQKESKTFSVVKYDSENRIPRNVHKKCMKLYEERCVMKNGGYRRVGFFSKLAAVKDSRTNLVNILMLRDNNAVFVLYIDNAPAAYMVCFYDEHRPVVYVPRLVANVEYLKYDPGLLLLNETIKSLLAEEIMIVDLTRGDEPYKKAMGGTVVNNYVFQKQL